MCATPPSVADSVGNGVSYDDKKVDVTINSVGGQLVVIALFAISEALLITVSVFEGICLKSHTDKFISSDSLR